MTHVSTVSFYQFKICFLSPFSQEPQQTTFQNKHCKYRESLILQLKVGLLLNAGAKSVSIHLISSVYTALRLQLEVQSNIFYIDGFILFFLPPISL